jgi:hypothetical protein
MVWINVTVSALILGVVEVDLERCCQAPAEQVTLPAKKGIGLDDKERLFPGADCLACFCLLDKHSRVCYTMGVALSCPASPFPRCVVLLPLKSCVTAPCCWS